MRVPAAPNPILMRSSNIAAPHRRIWSLAWPMILANLSVPALGLADTAMLGHLSDSVYLGAVAVGSSILAFIYWSFGFLRMGTTGASAQSHDRDADALLVKIIAVGILIGLIILCLRSPLINVGLQLMGSDGKLAELAHSYLDIRLLSAPAVLVNFAITGWWIGQQNTRLPLLIALVINSLNIGLDYLLIVHIPLQSQGAAIASLTSEYLGLLYTLFLVRHALQRALARGLKASLQQGLPLSALLHHNGHLFVRTVALLFSFAFFTAQGADMGEAILAANAILIQLVLAGAYGMDGFAHAAEALCGRAWKEKNRSEFLILCRSCLLWSLVSAGLASAVLGLGKGYVLALMTSIAEVRDAASLYYPWLIAMPLLAVWSYVLDGIFIGCLQTRAMQWCMLLCVGGVFLPLWYFSQGLENHGLWLSFASFNLARGLSLGLAFLGLTSSPRWHDRPLSERAAPRL